MCRHLAWLGRPRTLSSLVLDPSHGLLRQSYAPRRQQRGLLNADGWGVGFFAPGRVEPVRWRSARPLWGDASFASVSPVLSSGAVLAAVRSATVGMPLDESAAAPFTDGRWLLSHNGRVDRAVLPARSDAESVCDSAVLAAHVFAAGVDDVGRTVREVARLDPEASLNLLLTDGTPDPRRQLGRPAQLPRGARRCRRGQRTLGRRPALGRRPRPPPAGGDPRRAHRNPTGGPMTLSDLAVHLGPGSLAEQMAADVRAGLGGTPKTLPPKYFYDARGSELFDEITRLPEYYPTRAEREILGDRVRRGRGGHPGGDADRARQRHLGEDPAAAARAA